MRVLAIDPGERVGWARGVITGPTQDGTMDLVIEDHGIAGLRDFAVKLREVFGTYDVVVFEEYRISAEPRKLKAHIGSDVPTLQLIGMIRAESWHHPNVKLVKQSPSKKATALKVIPKAYPDIAERLAKLPQTHDDAHDGDALLHLAYWHWEEHA